MFRSSAWIRLVAVIGLVGLGLGVATAQTGKSKPKSKITVGASGVKQLDQRVVEMQEQLLKDAGEISKGYEDAGEYERAKWLLEVLQKLDPKLPGLKEKIDQLTEKSLDSSEFEAEVDVGRGWTPALAMVQKDRLIRIEATGEYKVVLSGSSTADGVPTNENGSDLLPGIPYGALAGVLINAETNKPGKPFEVKAKREWTSKEAGFLQLKVNLPNGHKSTGKLKVSIGGATKVGN
jgi:hypothetical protein